MTNPEGNNRPVVLLVDDDDGVRFTLSEVLAEADVDVLEAKDGEEGWQLFQSEEVDLVITDLRMPKVDGMELLERIMREQPGTKVVMTTAHGSESHAVQAMKLGAYDYFSKPFDVDDVTAVVGRATESVRLDRDNQRLRAELALARHMVFRSKAMSKVAQLIERAAPRDVTVLVNGPSGTGKELIADAIIAASSRADKSVVKFNCAALPTELAEAELFGHAAGAFTGAQRERLGVFREADGGTLFLDEIAELDMLVQGKLLRVIQEQEVRPVGEDRPQKINVRLIAATLHDLKERVKEKKFREDLFYRLNVIQVKIPALDQRRDDIDPLIDHFIKKYADRFGISPLPHMSPALRATLQAREYPGNVRELENTIERLVALSTGDQLTEEEIDGTPIAEASALGLKDRVEAFEKGLIMAELRRTNDNRSEAARNLGIGRVTLLDKLKKYKIATTD
jgi:two-component system, NtrC family, response regulator HydG